MRKWPGARDCWHFFYFRCLKRSRSTRLLAFLLIQMLKKAPEHETVGIFANLGAQNGPKVRDCCHFCYFRCLKRPRSTRLLAFLQLCICIFANLGAQNKPKVRDCCHFCYFRCSKRPRSTRLLVFLQLCIVKTRRSHDTVANF
jgi:hypothetical protein